MAPIWRCGWELNSTTADVECSTFSGTFSIQTTTVRSGTYALRTNPSATTGFARYHAFAANQSTAGFLRGYVNPQTLPSGNTTIMRLVDISNNPCVQVRMSSTGTLILLDAGGNVIGSASSALSTGQWYMLECSVDASSSPGTVAARLNGTTFASGANNVQAPWARPLIGPVVSTTCDLIWDDIGLNDSTGAVGNSWVGDSRLAYLFPNAAGDANAWNNTSNGAGSTSNFSLVNQIPPDDATTMVQTGSLNAEDMYNVTDPGINSWDTVNVVMVGGRHRNNTADAVTALKYQIRKTSGGTTSQSAAIVPNSTTWVTNAGAQPRNYPIILTSDPDGNPWTGPLDSVQIGMICSAAGTNRAQVTDVWAIVDYTPGTAPAGPEPPLISQYTGFF